MNQMGARSSNGLCADPSASAASRPARSRSVAIGVVSLYGWVLL